MSAIAAISSILPAIPLDKYKQPTVFNWQNAKVGDYPAAGDHGYVLSEDYICLDFDVKNYPTGRDMLSELWSAYLHYAPTFAVKTPRNGYHFYFKKPADVKLRVKQDKFPGVEFRSTGQQMVAPGTETLKGPNTERGYYEVLVDHEIVDIPAELLAALDRRGDAVTEGISNGSLLSKEQFERECRVMPPAISGQGGDNATRDLAYRGRDLGLPEDVTYQVMSLEWNPLCVPPWEEYDLLKKVQNAYKYAKNAAGSAAPEAKFKPDLTVVPPPAPTAEATNAASINAFQRSKQRDGVKPTGLDTGKAGALKNTQANVTFILTDDAAWKGKIKYNEFSSELEFTERPVWRENQLNVGVGLTKRDIAFLQVWFSNTARLEVADIKLVSALEAAATPYHPVRNYLDALRWDGKPRLDRILIDTAGVTDDNVYTRAVGKNLLLAAVKRIYQPGIKHDYVPVFEGRQGIKKSMWIQCLAGEWYSSSELVRGDKDTYQNLRGRWFVELPEINAVFNKQDFAWLKGIITNSTDVYRASYGFKSQAVPRESVFIGSINPSSTGEYLKDEENRRYWPIVTGEFDLARLERDRDQYFAEAVARVRKGEQHWLTREEEAVARQEQEKRREKDPWQELAGSWLCEKTEVTPMQVWAYLGITAGHVNSHHRGKLYALMRSMDFEYRAATGGGGAWVKRRQLTWGDVL